MCFKIYGHIYVQTLLQRAVGFVSSGRSAGAGPFTQSQADCGAEVRSLLPTLLVPAPGSSQAVAAGLTSRGLTEHQPPTWGRRREPRGGAGRRGGQPSLARREGPCEGCSVCGDCGSLESFAQCFLRAFSPQFQQLSCQHMTFKTVEKEPLLGMCSEPEPTLLPAPPAWAGNPRLWKEPASEPTGSLGISSYCTSLFFTP